MRIPFISLAASLGALLLCHAGAATESGRSDTRPTVALNIDAQPLVDALNAFARQSGLQIVFYSSVSEGLTSTRLSGKFSPQAALDQLLAKTQLTYEFINPRMVAIRAAGEKRSGAGTPADQMRLAAHRGDEAPADRRGTAGSAGAEVVVEGRREKPAAMAGGNLDLPRSEDDPLPYRVFTREELARKGVVDLSNFLQRELLESNPMDVANENVPDAGADSMTSSSGKLNLRGFGSDQTIFLVNGRRLPNVQYGTGTNAPDVNSVPVSMIERIEVLPATASAIYGAGGMGGVINIVLRPNAGGTEFSALYNNAAAGFDAPQATLSAVHGQMLMGGKLRLNLSANLGRVVPATEAELGYGRAEKALERTLRPPALTATVYGATPNIRSNNGSGLFGAGSSSVTSVAPGADGSGGIGAFVGREGVRNFDLYQTPGPYAGDDGVFTQYGQNRQRNAFTASVGYQVAPWLQLSMDATHAQTRIYRGYHRFFRTFNVPAASPTNPFGQAVRVSVSEHGLALGEHYQQARNENQSVAFGALMQLPAGWSLALDAQDSRSISRRRTTGVDTARWDALLAAGLYNPFRDTQVHPLPDAFYSTVLQYSNGVGGFERMEFSQREYSLRLSSATLPLPTGAATLVIGGNRLQSAIGLPDFEVLYGDNSVAYVARVANFYKRKTYDWGVYGELQAPLLPARWLPRGITGVHADIAWRYSGSDTYKQSPNPPTLALRLDFAAGLSLRGAYSVAYRSPDPADSVQLDEYLSQPDEQTISDPRRGGESYTTYYVSNANPDLLTERGETRSLGLIYQRGNTHRFRGSIDYLVTDKTDEITYLSATNLLTNEQYYSGRVQRETPEPGDPYGVGRVTLIDAAPINVLGRKSENWSGSLTYAWTQARGGVLEFSARGFWFDSYKTQLVPSAPVVENIENPDAQFTFLKYRASYGANWSRDGFTVGLDGRYYHSWVIPRSRWAAEGRERLNAYREFDLYVQSELSQWLPWKPRDTQVRGQLRINNLFAADLPVYYGASRDVRLYGGEWRGRTYSLSLSVGF